MPTWTSYALCALFLGGIGLFLRLYKDRPYQGAQHFMPVQEKPLWRMEAIRRFLSYLFIGEALWLLLFASLQQLAVLSAGMAAAIALPGFVLSLLIALLYVNTNRRFRAVS